MKTSVLVTLLVIVCSALFVLCDGLSAHWGKTGSARSLFVVMLLAPVSYSAFALINQRMDLAVTGALVNTLVVAGTSLVGVLVFKEQLSTLQYCGVGCALVGITLINVA